jgi:outer membrane protein TolC
MRTSEKTLKTILSAGMLLLLVIVGQPLAEPIGERSQTYEEMAEELRPGARLIRLSLQDSVAAAIENNLDIAVERYFPRINTALIQSEKGVFDPNLYFNATYVDRKDPLPSSVSVATGGLSAVETRQWVLTGGLAGAIPTGLIYDLNITSEHTPFSTITDAFETNGQQRLQTSLTVTQPLLKNFGTAVNTTGIRVAVTNREASIYQLEQKIIEMLFEVEQAYWELVFAYENLSVRIRSLELAQNLLDENRIRLKVGVIAPLDVLQSETGVAVREEEVIVARARLEDAKDRLIKTTNLLPEQLVWDVKIVPTDDPFVLPPVEYVEGDQIMTSLRNRSDLKQLLKLQEAAELGARFAKNQLLPIFDLQASVGLVGLDEDFDVQSFALLGLGLPLSPPFPDTGIDPAVDDLFSGDNLQWSIGFKFELPWGNRTERGKYRSANLQVSQLDASIQNLRLLIIQDTRNALREVQTNWQRLASTRETTRFRRKSLEAEEKKFEVGVSTAHDVLEFEEELAEAEAGERRAVTDYTLSLSNLLRATGSLLKVRNVQVAVDD